MLLPLMLAGLPKGHPCSAYLPGRFTSASLFEYAGQRPNVSLCNIYKLPPAGPELEPVWYVTQPFASKGSNPMTPWVNVEME